MPRPEWSPPYQQESPRERLAATLQVLEAGVDAIVSGEEFSRFLSAMSRFHHYSFGNVILIHVQRPSATQVAGYRKWLELGRQVKRGESGIKILVPHKREVNSAEEEVDEGDKRVVVTSFGTGTVFDISQTEGDPLPEPPLVRQIREASETGTTLLSHLGLYLEAEGIAVSHEQTQPANGYWEPAGRRIVLGLHLEGDQRAKTLAHETAHFVAGHELGMPNEDVETIAESAAFVILGHYGIDSSEYSFPYVARWAKDRRVLNRNLAAIQTIAHRIIDGLDGFDLPTSDHTLAASEVA